MGKAFEYRGFYIYIYLERSGRTGQVLCEEGYVPVIQIAKGDRLADESSRIRIGNEAGNPFGSEVEALDAGGAAARKIIADILGTNDKSLYGWKELTL